MHDFELSLVDDDSAVGEDEFGDAVDCHPLEDVEVNGVVVGLGGDGPRLERFELFVTFEKKRKKAAVLNLLVLTHPQIEK